MYLRISYVHIVLTPLQADISGSLGHYRRKQRDMHYRCEFLQARLSRTLQDIQCLRPSHGALSRFAPVRSNVEIQLAHLLSFSSYKGMRDVDVSEGTITHPQAH